MDYWFLDNLDKLVPIIIAVLYFIGASRAKNKGEEQEGPSPDASERARKIQEEIRRKVLRAPRQGESSFTGSGSTRARTGFKPVFEPDPSPVPPRPFQNPSPRGRQNLFLSRSP